MSKGLKALDIIANYQVIIDYEKDETSTIQEQLPNSCDIIEKDLKKLDALQPLLSFLREHISASNIRGECHITMRGEVGEISKELFDSIQELFK